jgi:hypothetical protein
MMMHKLVTSLPVSILRRQLTPEIWQLLNSLSVKAIFLDSSVSETECDLESIARNIFPLTLISHEAQSGYCQVLGADQKARLRQGHIPAQCEISTTECLGNLQDWLASEDHKWILTPFSVLPVVRAIMNIYPFDPYLAAHYLRQFLPVWAALDESDLELLLRLKLSEENPDRTLLPTRVQNYLKLELKLHRQYTEH